MKMNACAIVGSVWPTLSVPGISSSGTMRRSLKTDGRRRERADAERVEEVGDEPDGGLHGSRPRVAARFPDGADPGDEVDQRDHGERGEESRFRGHC